MRVMRARTPDAEGFVEHDGVKIHYEVHGDGGADDPALPTWTIIHKRFWKAQLPYLARHHRVVIYDGPGNGRSDRPLDPAAYGQHAQVAYALKVLDATGTDRAVLVGLSMAANWALDLAADHPRPGASAPSSSARRSPLAERTDRPVHASVDGPAPRARPPSRVPLVGTRPAEHWAKYNREYWREHYDDFLWFFFGQCFPEPHSTKQIEDGVGWGRETTARVLVAESRAAAARTGRPSRSGAAASPPRCCSSTATTTGSARCAAASCSPS